MIKKILCIAATIIFYTIESQAQVLSASVNRTQIPLGESFDLTLSLEGGNGGMIQPDLSVLQKDFNIYSTSNSMQSSFINGQSSVTRRWIIGLMPKKEGKQTIPAVTAGAYQTQPIDIEILPPATIPTTASANVSNTPQKSATKSQTGTMDNNVANKAYLAAELKVDNLTPYVQQQTNATLTIYDEKGVELTVEPDFIQPTNDWIIKSLRQPTVDNLSNGGRVIRFYYALFPQKSGVLEIPSLRLEGYYTEYNSANQPQTMGLGGFMSFFEMDFDNLLGVKKPITAQTKPVKVNVKPIAADYGNHWWLPSNAVGVAVRWAEDKPQFKVGETFAREIAVAAEGVADTQMPEITLPETPDIKQYPEQPKISTSVNGGKVTSHMLMRIVYIPQKAGKLEIPEISIPWFNVDKGKVEKAVIPADTILVQNNPLMETKPNDTNVQNMPQGEEGGNNAYTDLHYDAMVKQAVGELIKKIEIGIVIFLAFVAGLVLSWIWFKRQNKIQNTPENKNKPVGVEQSIKNEDYRALRDYLLAEGQTLFNNQPINNLDDLSAAVDNDAFRRQMDILNANLYAGKNDELDEKIILQNLKKCNKKKKNAIPKPLPDLYK